MVNHKLKNLSFKAEIYAGGLYAHCLLRVVGFKICLGGKNTQNKKNHCTKSCRAQKKSQNDKLKNALDRAPSEPQFPCGRKPCPIADQWASHEGYCQQLVHRVSCCVPKNNYLPQEKNGKKKGKKKRP